MLIVLLGLVACADAGDPTDPEFQSSSVVALGLWPQEPTIAVGDSLDFVAYGLTAVGDTVALDVTWSADGGEIKTNGKGKGRYRARAVGRNTVKATRDSLSDSTTVTVTPVPVASVEVRPNNATIETGETLQLAALVKDADGNELNERPVEWVSANPNAARVDDAGLVTGVGTGFSTIRATSEGHSGTAQVMVTTTPKPVAAVDVTPGTATIEVGGTVQLSATPRDTAGNALPGRLIVWSSAEDHIAQVNGSGLVTAVALGTATITATSEGQSGVASVTVTSIAPPPVASVDVTPSSLSLLEGQTGQLTATPRDAAGDALTGRAVSWSTSNAALAQVNGSGLVTGVALGTVTITATSEGQSGAANVTVTQPAGSGLPGDVMDLAVVGQTETALTLALTEVDDGEGNPASYAVRYAPSPLNWGQAAGSEFVVAGVQVGATLEFQITGLASGTQYDVQGVAFRGTLNNGAVFSQNLSNVATGTTGTNTAAVASVEVTPATASIGEGATVQLTATPKDAAGNALTGRAVSWATSDAAVATVNASGLVSGVAAGAATITATSEGESGTAQVTVTPPAPPGAGITGLSVDGASEQTAASGSDNWPLTWCEDGHQYTAWGDGDGFGSSRVSLGFARIEGAHANWTGYNLWTGNGKVRSILCINGILYALRSPNSDTGGWEYKEVLRSTDKGVTFSTVANSRLDGGTGGPGEAFYIQYGQNYSENTDGYVYIFSARIANDNLWDVQAPGVTWLARAPVAGEAFMYPVNWEWVTALDGGFNPTWGAYADRVPVLEDPNGFMRGSAIYIPPFDRYVMVTNHTARNVGNIAMWEAPEPWGPWTTFRYETGSSDFPQFAFGNFSPKWLDAAGNCVFVWFRPDAWNSVACRFAADGTPAPAPNRDWSR